MDNKRDESANEQATSLLTFSCQVNEDTGENSGSDDDFCFTSVSTMSHNNRDYHPSLRTIIIMLIKWLCNRMIDICGYV